MSWKTRYLEAENARLRADNRLLMAALLNQAGQRTAAEMIRQPEPAAKEVPSAVIPKSDGSMARGWRGMAEWWKRTLAEPVVEESDAKQ